MLPNKGGRPRKDNPRANAVPIRLTDDELTLIKGAAEGAGKATGEYIRESAVNRAKKAKKAK